MIGNSNKNISDAFRNLIRRGIRMWEEATCLRFQENVQARDAIRYSSPLTFLTITYAKLLVIKVVRLFVQ